MLNIRNFRIRNGSGLIQIFRIIMDNYPCGNLNPSKILNPKPNPVRLNELET